MAKRRRPARPHRSNVSLFPPVWAFCLITASVATAMRLCFPIAWGEQDSLASAFLVGDARAYHDYAAHLIAGRRFDNGVPFHPPGWAFVLAGIFRLAGFDPLNGSPANPAILKALVGTQSGVTVALAALLANRVAGRGAMLATGVWGSVHFGHMALGTVPSNETLYGLAVVIVLLTAHRLHDKTSPDPTRSREYGVAALLGVAAGAAALVRAEFLAACVLIGAWLWWTRKGAMSLRFMSAYLLGLLVALGPAAAANWRSIAAFNERNAAKLPGPLPRWAPVTSYGAFNFAIANHPESDGGPNNDHPLLEAASLQEKELLAEGGLNLATPSVHRLYVDGYSIGSSWMVHNPADAAALLIEKGRRALGALAHGVLYDNFPAGVDGTRRRVDLVDPDSRVLLPVSFALLAAGMWMLRRRPDAWPLYAAMATLALSTLGFFGYVRLTAAYLPVIWVFQSAAVSALAASLPMPRAVRRRPGLAVVLLMMTLAAVSIGSLSSRRAVEIDGPRGFDGQVIVDETVRITGR
ncbi:MAG TPA: hypothetical protein VJ813_03630 [Vicinamibacterales bacterium]|nr:hypothetical protein [Vicinamibacterales bacterium]